MAEVFQVNATLLNVRQSPVINPGNVMGHLGQGELVEKLGQPSTDWMQVKNGQLSGFVAARFLNATTAALPAPVMGQAAFVPPQVNFLPDPRAALDSTEQRHCPLGLPQQPRAMEQSDETRCAQLNANVQLLDVEHSARYQPTSGITFCNIYAYDCCYIAGVYLPRVWWMAKALLELSRGTSAETLGVVYGKTVQELTANALFDWLSEWGADFGWRRCSDVVALQAAVNRGAVGLICAQRRDLSRSGHIVVVVPESSAHAAQRAGQTVVIPLQSQAGARNKQYFSTSWWVDLAVQFRATGFWVSG
jgi:hypothetical protein